MTTPAMLAYVATGAVKAPDSSNVLYDPIRNQVYLASAGTGTTCGLHQFDGSTTGSETWNKTLAQLGVSELHMSGPSLTQAGYLNFNEFTANSTTLGEVYAPTGSLVNQFGISGSSLSASTPARILTPGSQARARYGNTEFIISCPLVSGHGEVCLLTIPGLVNSNLGAISQNLGFCGPGAVGNSSGSAFVLGFTANANLQLYNVTVSATGGSIASSGTVSPSAVDATWTHFTAGTCGCAFDQTDGNPIIFCTTTDSVTTQNYFVKLNAANAAVIWVCAIPNIGSVNAVDLAQSQITKQTLYYMGGSHTLYTINTSTGVAVATTIGTLTSTSCVSEDVYGSFIGYATAWSQTTTVPAYLGIYMGAPGNNHTLANTWYRFFPGGLPTPAPPIPPALPEPGVVSNVQAWTYVQDGHTFYVLDLGTQGTFAFDTKTSQWCQMQTNGGNWAMVNGIMWGQRVVAGDPASTDVWELDPAATKDSGGLYDIAHVVTGGISTRARTYISCDAVRISASFGQLDETGNVTFNLRWSDDQGQNWSAYYPVTMTAGNFDAEIAWRSLGSFNAPGRIFEFSDSGGLVRIDGCDAFLNGFDNDQQSQENEQS